MTKARHLFEQLASEKKTTKEINQVIVKRLRGRLNKVQEQFIFDVATRKAALCPRRSGKSWAILFYVLITCLLKPRANCLVIGITRGSAKAVYWTLLKQLCTEFDIKVRFHNTELSCTFNNGSRAQFAGADTIAEIEKFRGPSYDLVCIDECKSYSSKLFYELIIEVIEPALSDRLGTLAIIGTPGAVLHGPFWEITTRQGAWVVHPFTSKKPRTGVYWSLHKWTVQDNTAAPWIWTHALNLKNSAGWEDTHPTWIREYCGEWASDELAMVYVFATLPDTRCYWKPVDGPNGLNPGHKWRYLLGVDLGWHDEVGIVVAAWCRTSPDLHFIHSEKQPHLTVAQIADRVHALEDAIGSMDVRIADTGGLGKTIVESLGRDYQLPFIAAKKTDKADHIKIMNSYMEAGHIKVDPESCLADEWRTLQWFYRGPGRAPIEDPGCPNHAADAALYLHRYAHLQLYKDPAPEKTTEVKEKEEAKKYEMMMRDRFLAEKRSFWWDRVGRRGGLF